MIELIIGSLVSAALVDKVDKALSSTPNRSGSRRDTCSNCGGEGRVYNRAGCDGRCLGHDCPTCGGSGCR